MDFSQIACLYVEDDALSRQVMDMIMRHAMGVSNLMIFEDTQNVMQKLKALPRRPDVILLDIQVKPLDGFAVLNLLRGDPEFARARVIALTASVMSEEVERLRASGFDGAIGKPVSITTFPALIAQVLNGQKVWRAA
jgi:CheY-like chemotaxis protein